MGERFNQFDIARITGVEALKYSHDWLTKPSTTADRFSKDYMPKALGPYVPKSKQDLDTLVNASIGSSMCFGRWAMSGFPTVTFGHRTAAAIMATRIKPDDAETYVRSPWPAFAIRIPPGMLFIEGEGVLYDATVLMVTCVDSKIMDVEAPSDKPWFSRGQYRWWYRIMAQSALGRPDWMHPAVEGFYAGLALWGFNLGTHDLATPDGGAMVEEFTYWNSLEKKDIDSRSEQLARALIIGASLHLAGNPLEQKERNQSAGVTVRERKSKKREGDELPQYTEFEVHSSIKINLHHAIRDYVEHGGSAPSVQTLTSGHWKQQAYDKGFSKRRLIHINPYWRGELDAPVSVRMK